MIQEISLPVQIDGFTFHEIGFSIKGREYPYENIASLKFLIQNTTINFSTDETYILGIRTHSDEIISIHVSDAYTLSLHDALPKECKIGRASCRERV